MNEDRKCRLKTGLSFLTGIAVYAAYTTLLYLMLEHENDDLLWLTSFIFISGMGAFLAFFCTGLLAPREYKYIIGGLQLYLLYAGLIFLIAITRITFWSIAGRTMHLSFSALGALLAIRLSYKSGSARYTLKKPEGVITTPFLTVWASVKGLLILFRRYEEFHPGIKVEMDKCPVLKQAIDDVCKKLNSDVPDHIILSDAPVFFVCQGTIKLYDDKVIKGRILALGVPLLRQMETAEMASVLAHAFAHFTGDDAAYSLKVLPVYRLINQILQEFQKITHNSFRGWILNILLAIPRICLITYKQYFTAINIMQSRNSELRADYLAIENYGFRNFESALKKVVRISTYYADIILTLAMHRDCFGVFNQALEKAGSRLVEIENKALKEEDQLFASHPSLSTRLDSHPLAAVSFDPIHLPGMELILKELRPVTGQLVGKHTAAINQTRNTLSVYRAYWESTR